MDVSELLKQTVEKDQNRVHYLQQIVTLVPESDRAAFLRTHIVEAKWNVHLNNPQKTLIIQGSCISEEEQSSMLSYLEDQATMAWEDTAERCRLM